MLSDLHMEVDDWSGHIPEHPDDESLRESLRQSPANKQRYSEGFILLKQVLKNTAFTLNTDNIYVLDS